MEELKKYRPHFDKLDVLIAQLGTPTTIETVKNCLATESTPTPPSFGKKDDANEGPMT